MQKSNKRLVGELTFCLLLLGFSLAVIYQAYQIAGFSSINGPGSFPLGVSFVMLLAALAILFEQRKKAAPDTKGLLDAASQFARQHFPKRTLIFGVLAAAYLAAIPLTNFYASTFLFLVLSIAYLRKGRVLSAITVAAMLLALIYLLFSLAFSVYLP